MKITQNFRAELSGVSTWIVEQFDSIIAQIKGTWGVEHNDDGTHSNVTATSVTTTGDVEIGGDLSVDGLVGPLDFGTASTPIVLDGTKIGPETAFDYSAFPSGGSSADTETSVLRSVKSIVPSGDGTADLGYEGTTLRRWRNGFFKNLVESKYLHATTGFYERFRSVASGEWQDVPHASGNFTADAGTWSVAAGDQSVYRYSLNGKSMTIDFAIATFSTSAGMGTQLRIALPAGFTIVHYSETLFRLYTGGIGGEVGYLSATSGQTYLSLRRLTDVAWPSSHVDDCYVFGQITIEV